MLYVIYYYYIFYYLFGYSFNILKDFLKFTKFPQIFYNVKIISLFYIVSYYTTDQGNTIRNYEKL